MSLVNNLQSNLQGPRSRETKRGKVPSISCAPSSKWSVQRGDTGVSYRIYALEDQWYSPGAQYFKVRTDGKRFILRYDQVDDEWTLQSAYDGAELFARSGVRMVTIDRDLVRVAETLIFLNKRRAENIELLVTVLRDNLQRLTEKVGQLSEEQQCFLQTDFVELVADGLRKAEDIRAKDRIVRIAMILGNVAEAGPFIVLDDAEELMRIAVNLSDLDVAVLREIY